MKDIARVMTACVAAFTALLSGCGIGSSLAVYTIPADYKLKSGEIGLSGTDLGVTSVHDYKREGDGTLVVVQLNYHSKDPLRCYDEQNRGLSFVGTLVAVNAESRSALIAGGMQITREKGSIAYVYSAPGAARAITVGSYGKRDLARGGSLPAVSVEEVKIEDGWDRQ
jgi:hypothetical protein